MDEISKQNALHIGAALVVVIIVVLAAVWWMAPPKTAKTAKVAESVQQVSPQSEDPMAELQKLLDKGKVKPLWKQYLETYWPAAVVFIGLVVVVIRLLKRRRLANEEEGILAMDDEDVPSSPEDKMPPEERIAAEAMEGEAKKPWPWAKIVSGLGLVAAVLIAFTAIYSFFSITGLERSQAKLEKEMAEKVGRGSFDSLGTTVADLKSTTEVLTSKMEDTRGRLATVEAELETVKSTANEAYSIASRAATRVAKLDEKVTRETNAINRTFTTISKGFARQDSINAFLASKFSISQSEMDSLAAWFPKKPNVPN